MRRKVGLGWWELQGRWVLLVLLGRRECRACWELLVRLECRGLRGFALWGHLFRGLTMGWGMRLVMGGRVIFRWWRAIAGRCRGSRLRFGDCWRRRVVLGVVGLWELLVRLGLRELQV